jgi:hypothetical protein
VTAVDPGFGVDHRLTVRMSLPLARYAAAPQRMAFYTQLFDFACQRCRACEALVVSRNSRSAI